jgi:hypothetical protein
LHIDLAVVFDAVAVGGDVKVIGHQSGTPVLPWRQGARRATECSALSFSARTPV